MADDDDRDRKAQDGREAKWTKNTLEAILNGAEGRWWLAGLLDYCGAFSQRYGLDGDALGMAWRDGRANVGLHLLAQIETHAPDRYAQMMRERRERIERAAKKAEEDRRKAEFSKLPDGETLIDRLADRQATLIK